MSKWHLARLVMLRLTYQREQNKKLKEKRENDYLLSSPYRKQEHLGILSLYYILFTVP